MISYLPAITYAGAYVKTLEMDKNKALKVHRGNFEAKMAISSASWADIDWWVVNLPHAERPVRIIRPDITIYTDASLEGWGTYTEPTGQQPITPGAGGAAGGVGSRKIGVFTSMS